MERDRAFAQTEDHRVAPGLDPLGDGDFAFAAEQLDRAHFAQVHPHRIVGTVDRFLLLLDRRAFRVGFGVDLVLDRRLVGIDRILVALDDVDAHFRDRGHDVLDLLGGHLVLRQSLIQLVIGDHPAPLGPGDQFLDRGVVEIDQRRIAAVLVVAVEFFVHVSAIGKAAPIGRPQSVVRIFSAGLYRRGANARSLRQLPALVSLPGPFCGAYPTRASAP